MPLQNRVDPWGVLVATRARGTMMGNRGVLHDDEQRVVRPQGSAAWIICQLEFKGRRRELMTPGAYTELFFLDEATALAAGHRPCFECRRDEATRFLDAWQRMPGHEEDRVPDVDRQLSGERRMPRSGISDGKRAYRGRLAALPDGVIVELDGAAWLRVDGHLVRWSFEGYDPESVVGFDEDDVAWVLTPPSTVRTIANGYTPSVHPSLSSTT